MKKIILLIAALLFTASLFTASLFAQVQQIHTDIRIVKDDTGGVYNEPLLYTITIKSGTISFICDNWDAIYPDLNIPNAGDFEYILGERLKKVSKGNNIVEVFSLTDCEDNIMFLYEGNQLKGVDLVSDNHLIYLKRPVPIKEGKLIKL